MPNFKSKGGLLQKFSKAARAARKVQGSITFDPGTRLGKKIPLRRYVFTPCVKISWTSDQNWLHRILSKFSIVYSTNNCLLGLKWYGTLYSEGKILYQIRTVKDIKKILRIKGSSLRWERTANFIWTSRLPNCQLLLRALPVEGKG